MSVELPELQPNWPHFPVVTRRSNGLDWGVFCNGCSEAAGDYVYPCRFTALNQLREWPPDTLYEATKSDRTLLAHVTFPQNHDETITVALPDLGEVLAEREDWWSGRFTVERRQP